MKNKIILFGSSDMAEEYLKVLKEFNSHVIVIGRNKKKAEELANRYGFEGYGDSTSTLNEIDCNTIDLAIIASSVESLKEVAVSCINKNIKKILLEKPGALNLKELEEIRDELYKKNKEKNQKIKLYVALNRRFYNSITMLREIIKKNNVAGCFFDFTEREKDLFNSGKSNDVISRWGFANSIHVIDTAFFLIGRPLELYSKQGGKNYLNNMHPAGNTFVGHGKTGLCLFSYFATWGNGGRWDIEISTNEGRYKLSPLEELQFCEKDQFNWKKIELIDRDDEKFKPGLFKMTKAVLNESNSMNILPTIEEQIEICKIINEIFGYK